MLHTFVALVEDKPGLLSRVTSLFRRLNVNITSLTVGGTETAGASGTGGFGAGAATASTGGGAETSGAATTSFTVRLAIASAAKKIATTTSKMITTGMIQFKLRCLRLGGGIRAGAGAGAFGRIGDTM